MSKRKIPSAGDRVNSYKVGYGKPPTGTQFKRGKSGNPAGRPKGVPNLMSDVKRTLEAHVKIKTGRGSRRMRAQLGMLTMLREKALSGDTRALDRLIELAQRFNSEVTPALGVTPLELEDEAILEAFARDIAGDDPASNISSPRSQRSQRNSGEGSDT
jgi:hypothetical protein